MQRTWNILYYSLPKSTSPIYTFIEDLEKKAKIKVAHTLDLLTEYGVKLGLPHVKKLAGNNLWELRILGNDSIRIFYIAITGKNFLLLHGFIKKKNKTDQKEVKIASKRLEEYISRT